MLGLVLEDTVDFIISERIKIKIYPKPFLKLGKFINKCMARILKLRGTSRRNKTEAVISLDFDLSLV